MQLTHRLWLCCCRLAPVCLCVCNPSIIQGITTVYDDAVLVDCPKLRSLDGLRGIRQMGKDLVLRNLKSLTTTAGLSNLTSVGAQGWARWACVCRCVCVNQLWVCECDSRCMLPETLDICAGGHSTTGIDTQQPAPQFAIAAACCPHHSAPTAPWQVQVWC